MSWATLGVVLACCGVFFWQIGLPYHAHEALILTYGLRPSAVFEHSFLDVFSADARLSARRLGSSFF